MVTRIQRLALAVAPLLLTTGLAACHHSTPAEVNPTVKFVQPTDGQNIALTDDEDAATAGVQYSIKVHVEHVTSSATATLLIDGSAIAGGKQSITSTSGTADLTFARTTLPTGGHTLTVRVDDAGSGKKGQASVAVTVVGGSCAFVSPHDGDTLGATADQDPATPGMEAQVKVSCPGVPVGSSAVLKVAVLVGSQHQDLTPLTGTIASDGTATFDKAPLGEGKNAIYFEADDASGHALGSAQETVTVDTGACAVVLGDRNGVIYNAAAGTPPDPTETRPVVADADPATAGIQETFTAFTTCAAGSTASIAFGGGASAATATVDASGKATFNNVTIPDGDPVTEVVTVSDTSANKSGQSQPNSYGVDSVVPQLSIVAPADGSTLTQADDLDPNTTGLQTQVTLHATVGVDSATYLSVKDNGTTLVAPAKGATVGANGNYTFPTNVTLPLGSNPLVATATRRLGNSANATSTVTVTQSSLSITLLQPSSTTITCTHAPGDTTDENLSTADCDLTMKVQVDSTATSVDFAGTGPGTVAGGQTNVTPTNGQASVQFQIPQGDGYVLTATAHDATGATQSVSVNVKVHTVPPTIAFTTPDHSTAFLSGQTQDITVHVTGAATGEQIVLSSSGGNGQVSVASVGTVDASGAADVTFSGVTLPLGAQTLTATISDSYGNSGSDSVTLTVVSSGQCDLTITGGSPQVFNIAGTAQEVDGGMQRVATITGATTLCMGQAVTLTKTVGGNTTTIGTVNTDVSTGAFSIDAVLDDNEIDATMTASLGTGPQAFSENVTYTSDFTPPHLDGLLPAEGQVLVVPNGDTRSAPYVADEVPSTAGGQFTPTIAISGAGRLGTVAETGTGSLTIVGAGVNTGLSGITDQAQQTFNNQLSFADGPLQTVTITATDAAGNSTTATWDVAVATTPLPTLTLQAPTGTLNVFRDLKPFHTDHIDYQGYVTFSSQIAAGTEVYICSTTAAPNATKSCVQASPSGTVDPGSDVVFGVDGGPAPAAFLYAADVQYPEGSYQVFAEAVSSVGDTVDSSAVNLTVDSVPPSVTSVTVAEDSNGDNILNAAELASTGGVAHVTAGITGAEPGQTATLQDGSSTYTATVTGTLASSTATFAVSGLADGSTHNFKVLVTDAAGNPNETNLVSPAITNPTDLLTVRVATSAPSVAVVSPNFTTCNLANGADANSKTCNLTFTVDVGAGTGLAVTEVDFGGPGAPSNGVVTPSHGSASASYSVPEGTAQTLTALVKDSAGNTATAQVTLLVDATAPDLTITSPTGGTQNGQDFTVSVSTGASDVSTVTIISSATQPSGQSIGSGTFSNGVATVSVHAPVSASEQLTAVATDNAGNPGSSTPITLQVTQPGCDLQFTNPSAATVTINQQTPGQNAITVTGYSTQCPNWPVTYYVTVNGGTETVFGSGTTDGSGSFSQQITLQDGAVTKFRAEMVRTSVTNSASFTATVDVTAPTITINSPTPGPSGTLYVVAQTGNRHVAAGDPGYVADVSPINGGQVSLDLTIVGGGSVTSSGTGTLTITDANGNRLATESITSNGTVNYSPGGTPLVITLPQAYQGAVKFLVTDAAGNLTSAEWSSVAVDVVAPLPAVAIVQDPGDGGYSHIVNARHADLEAVFALSPDDGLDGGQVTVDFGYVTSTALDGGVFDEAAFENHAITSHIAVQAAPTMSVKLVNVPPLNIVYTSMREMDSVGNVSTFGVGSTFDDRLTDLVVPYPGQGTGTIFFGSRIAVGDIDGDGLDDIAVWAQLDRNFRGAVYVYYGRDWPGDGGIPDSAQVLVGSDGGSSFGAGLELADINGDGRSDLVAFDNDRTDVFLAPGDGGELSVVPSFSVSGDSSARNAVNVGDVNGDGIDDLVIWSYSAGVGGVAYLFFGRPSWASVNVSSADVTISSSTSGAQLGGGARGIIGLPDLDGDGKGELLIGAPGASTAFVVPGSALSEGAQITVEGSSVTVIRPAGGSGTQFGYSATIGPISGSGSDDLIIGMPSSVGTLAVASRQSGAIFNSTANTVDTGPSGMAASIYPSGRSTLAADFNQDGVPDVAVGTQSFSSGQVGLLFSGNNVLNTDFGAVLGGGATFGYDVAFARLGTGQPPALVISEPYNGTGDFHVIR